MRRPRQGTKDTADLTLEEAIILVKNNGANKKVKRSENNNKSVFYLEAPTMILSKYKNKAGGGVIGI